MKRILFLSLFLLLAPISINSKNKISFGSAEIMENVTKENIEYKYVIYGDDNNVMDAGATQRIEPNITNIGGILELCISAGTGLRNCRYYDTKKNVKSDWFETPILTNNKYVVSFNKLTEPTGIIVEDIFDKSKFYKEYGVNFSSDAYPIKKIKFINDSIIWIVYEANENETETKIIFLR